MRRAALILGFAGALAVTWSQRAPRPYAVQMHIHGWSHHGNPWAGSMAAHSWYAKTTGTEVIWWSDHHHIFHPANYDFEVDFAGAQVDPATLDVLLAPEPEIPGAPAAEIVPRPAPGRPVLRYLTRLMAQSSGGTPAARIDGTSLHLEVAASGTGEWQRFALTPRGPAYPHVGFWPGQQYERMTRSYFLSRPLTSGLRLRAEVEPGPLHEDVRQAIVLDLTYHHIGRLFRQRLAYRLVPEGRPAVKRVTGAESVEVDLPVKNGWNQLDLDLPADAGLMEEGRDNTILELFFEVQARRGQRASLRIGRWGLSSTVTGVQENYDALAGFAKEYMKKYGVRQYAGVEWTETPHLNAFIPARASGQFGELLTEYRRPNFAGSSKASPEEFIQRVHKAGGLVSLNHVYGASHAGLSPASERGARGVELARMLLGNRAHGADLFEAGYTHRGGADLHDHLRVWDLLTANGLMLAGTGVSDTHSVPWEEFSKPESFVTWVWAGDDSDQELLDGLRKRRAYFGSPFRFRGRFDVLLRTEPAGGEARMGETLVTDAARGWLTIEMEPKRQDDHVFLIQCKVKPGMDLEYLSYHRRVNPYEPILVNLGEPSFLRLEVYDGRRLPVLFSNPILIRRK